MSPFFSFWRRRPALTAAVVAVLFSAETAGAQATRSLQSTPVAPVTAGSGPAPASTGQPDGFVLSPSPDGQALAQLRRFVSDTRAARGEFVQRTLRAAGRPAETASGVFAFSRPGKFRWEVRKPFEQLMVADGERLWFLDKDLNQVIERRLSESLGASPAAILFGTNDMERSFELREGGNRDGLDWLQALPRSRDAGFERIAIGFRAGLPEAMEVLDAFGRTTRFAFREIQRNPALDASLFSFQVPKGADLIRQ